VSEVAHRREGAASPSHHWRVAAACVRRPRRARAAQLQRARRMTAAFPAQSRRVAGVSASHPAKNPKMSQSVNRRRVRANLHFA